MERPGAPSQGPPPSRGANLAGVWGGVIGGAFGFGLGAIIYLQITPILERSTGWVGELQGLSWNLVPSLAIVGVFLGMLAGLAFRRPARRRHSPDA